MRVTVVGAGPAGLYLAILLRKAGHDVTVLERNAPDATFGWGVVFSEETLGALRDADAATHLEITDSFARWSTVDIRYQGKLLRSRGHSFSAIARKHLLAILQRRAHELGADLRFGVEIEDLDFPDADLIVAADGANSRVRNRDAKRFRANVAPQGCKYVWFGTDLVLDSFTFSFKETEFGLFQAHAYPFDEHTSTWIVECAEPVWRRAGLDTMTEAESIAFCEKLFADDLAGHRLMSNRSLWLDFPLVRCASWHHGNIVLLGDSAHTAHFSIGSGTKLAMEDAIGLTTALARHTDLGAALTEYELDRQPMVERFQQAAGESAAYFGRTATYTGFAPIQFAFNLLTRSGRVSHTNLAQRDPDLIRVLDAWFAHGADQVPGAVAPPPLFAPLRVGGTRLPNRLAVEDTDPVRAARTGAGLVLAGPVAVTPEGRAHAATPVMDSPGDWAAIADKVHDNGTLLGLRLGHAGARGATRAPADGLDIPLPAAESWPIIAASAVPYAPFAQTPKAMDAADLDRVRQAFTDAAGHAAKAGIDVLELDLADGHLLAGFLSPLTNRRDDEWTGWAYPLSVIDAVRAVWPRLLSVRLTVTDWTPRGLTLADGIQLASAVHSHGADLIHVRAGQTTAEARPEFRRGYLTALSDQVRNQTSVPTMVGGYLTTPDEVNTIVAAGRADLCVLSPAPSAVEAVVLS
ncbi:Anthraniloyl-CoA monooxygenase [Alloactinosynnema sp. L-07]|uniref:oxidoreductase n=1 Tax=Alloactinosynnema sp. L-07 TaxID=1653480 RepID=UPI00065EFDC9|nr:FAD-dependent monooxygenase [Alloactinosynnema sp. L-07]CRK57982.1 Anthraniloyl-CoA monooxygenase [Alloactinosynnema sp. L-07]